VCQKDKDFSGLTGKRDVHDPTENEINVSLEDAPESKVGYQQERSIQCLEYDVVYKSSRVDVIHTILRFVNVTIFTIEIS